MTAKTYYKWKPDELQNAIHEYRSGGVGLNECARLHKIPKATLKRHLDKSLPNESVEINKGARRVPRASSTV